MDAETVRDLAALQTALVNQAIGPTLYILKHKYEGRLQTSLHNRKTNAVPVDEKNLKRDRFAETSLLTEAHKNIVLATAALPRTQDLATPQHVIAVE